LECKTIPEECPAKTNHIPIITTLDMSPSKQEETPRPNFKVADWTKFREELNKKLNNLDSQEEIHNEHEFHARLEGLTTVITDTIELTVPRHRPLPYTKRWWNNELLQKHTEVQNLGRRSYT